MAQVLIRNIDDEALDELRKLAKANSRPLEAELRLLIEEAGRRRKRAEGFWERADLIAESLRDRDQTDSAVLRRIGRRGDEE